MNFKKIRLVCVVVLAIVAIWEIWEIRSLTLKIDEENRHKIVHEETKKDNDLENRISFLINENQKLRGELQKIQNRNQELEKDFNTINQLINSDNITLVQGVNRKQLRDIIENTLMYLEEANYKSFTNLLMITAQVESDLGHFYKQVRGPAVGVFQIEPSTEKSIWDHYLKYRKNLSNKVKKLQTKIKLDGKMNELQWNIAYSSAIAYLVYKQRNINPSKMTTKDMFQTYKVVYNTYKGKATMEKMYKKTKGSKILEGKENYVARR